MVTSWTLQVVFGQLRSLIDARDAGSYEAGHIPGAILMDAEKLDSDPLFDQAKLPDCLVPMF